MRVLVTLQGEPGCVRLVLKSAIGTHPVGLRVLRGEPLPLDRFEFTQTHEAVKACSLLQAYIDQNR